MLSAASPVLSALVAGKGSKERWPSGERARFDAKVLAIFFKGVVIVSSKPKERDDALKIMLRPKKEKWRFRGSRFLEKNRAVESMQYIYWYGDQ